jgi:5'-nucleotidase
MSHVTDSSEPLFLISNDDGVHAAGLHALAAMVRPLGETCVFAPDREQSATSHSLTLHRPLRVELRGPRVWAVDGTPTDAVHLALRASILPRRPTMVLSGINHGGNLGDEITYSGTVAAAMEGALLGCPAIAFSCLSQDRDGVGLDELAPLVQQLVGETLRRGLPFGTLLNVNFPDPRRGPVRGFKITTQGRLIYGAQVVEKTDPRDRKYYWIAGEVVDHPMIPGSDVEAVANGWASVTPVHLDLTDHRLIESLRSWSLEASATAAVE